jgi:hypothetical protein
MDKLVSKFAFNFNLRRYIMGDTHELDLHTLTWRKLEAGAYTRSRFSST